MEIVTSSAHPELQERAGEAFRVKWPEFIFHDPVSREFIGRAGELFPQFDVLLRDGDSALANAWAVPFRWDSTAADLPEGYDGAPIRAVQGHDAGVVPSTLCVMAAAVANGVAARGLAAAVLRGLRERAGEAGLEHVIVPVRPTLKHRYPLTPMVEYARWRRNDNLSIDPWIRTHERMGAAIIGVAHRSMVIDGSVAEWEEWSGMVFPVLGDYVVPEALGLVRIDRALDRGTYVEENLWMQHV